MISPDEKSRIIELAKSGLSKEAIRKLLNISSGTFYRFIKNNKIVISPAKKFFSEEEKNTVSFLLKSGKTLKEIGVIIGRPPGSISKLFRASRPKLKTDIVKMLEMHDSGMRPNEIAKFFNVDVSSIRRSLFRRGKMPIKAKLACEDLSEDIVRYVEAGKTQVEICSLLNVKSNTLNNFIKRHNLGEKIIKNYRYATSQAEKEILAFLAPFNPINKYKYQGLKEIDIYLPNQQIGIEYCGMYWHRESLRGKTLHINKMRDCQKRGIKLLTIFDYEWLSKKDIIKSIILSKLGSSPKKLGARKCECRIVSATESTDFFKNNHMQSAPPNQILSVGLFYNDILVGCMSFGKHHRNGRIIILNRLAFLKNCSISGGASRLLKFAADILRTMSVPEIVTYSDNRWSEGGVYHSMGFEKVADLPKDYFYIKNHLQYSKQSMKKTSQEKLLTQTEYELRLKDGYDRVWDCGKIKWKLNLR